MSYHIDATPVNKPVPAHVVATDTATTISKYARATSSKAGTGRDVRWGGDFPTAPSTSATETLPVNCYKSWANINLLLPKDLQLLGLDPEGMLQARKL